MGADLGVPESVRERCERLDHEEVGVSQLLQVFLSLRETQRNAQYDTVVHSKSTRTPVVCGFMAWYLI